MITDHWVGAPSSVVTLLLHKYDGSHLHRCQATAVHVNCFILLLTQLLTCCIYTMSGKRCLFIFDYNSHISWWICIIDVLALVTEFTQTQPCTNCVRNLRIRSTATFFRVNSCFSDVLDDASLWYAVCLRILR